MRTSLQYAISLARNHAILRAWFSEINVSIFNGFHVSGHCYWTKLEEFIHGSILLSRYFIMSENKLRFR